MSDLESHMEDEILDFHEVMSAKVSRVFLMGPVRSGKSSIQQVIFRKMSPHETLFLECTQDVIISKVSNNDISKFQIWDISGEYAIGGGVAYNNHKINDNDLFGICTSLVYVHDAQDDDNYETNLSRLVDTVAYAHRINPNILFEILTHKVDGEQFISEEQKVDRQRDINNRILNDLNDNTLKISFYMTSVYDYSIYEAFSRLLQKLTPHLAALESLLNILVSSCLIEKAYLFDSVTKLIIANDSTPSDINTSEMCSDMIDVSIDVSYVYGMKPLVDGASSIIRLGNGMIIYMREIAPYLALVVYCREGNFIRRGLVDFNIDCFRRGLGAVFENGVKVVENMRSDTRESGKASWNV